MGDKNKHNDRHNCGNECGWERDVGGREEGLNEWSLKKCLNNVLLGQTKTNVRKSN